MSLLIKFDALQWAISEYCTKCSNFKTFNSKLFKWCLFFCTLFTDTKINCNIGAKTTLEIEIKKYKRTKPSISKKIHITYTFLYYDVLCCKTNLNLKSQKFAGLHVQLRVRGRSQLLLLPIYQTYLSFEFCNMSLDLIHWNYSIKIFNLHTRKILKQLISIKICQHWVKCIVNANKT